MFAYCGNCPIIQSDASGTSPWGKLTLEDYRLIHKMVQKEVADSHGWSTEVYIKSEGGRRGYLDIYDSRNNEFYEVKSVGAAGKVAALVNQLLKYLHAIVIKTDTVKSYPKLGKRQDIRGNFTYGIHEVHYAVVAPGLIQYSVDDGDLPQYELVYEPVESKTSQPIWNPEPIPVPIFFWPSFGGSGGGGGAWWNVLHPQMT